jgi:hypothetical protein
VLPNNIVDVSSFIDSMVDVNLMDDCAKELASRFEKVRIQNDFESRFIFSDFSLSTFLSLVQTQ